MFYGNNPFQRPMFGGQYGALSPFGKDIMDQIGRKEEGNIGGFLGEVRDMAEDRFEIDFDGNRYGIGGLRPPRAIAFTQKATQADVFDSPDKATEEQPPVLMANGGAPMYADQGSQFMPTAGRPPVPASVQMANELDQIDRMKQQRESTIIQKIAEQRGVSVEEVLRLLALANAAEATPANPPTGAPVQEMTPTNIPYPDAPSATVMQQGGPRPSEWDMLTEGEKMRIMNNLEMGNVPRPEVAVPMETGGSVDESVSIKGGGFIKELTPNLKPLLQKEGFLRDLPPLDWEALAKLGITPENYESIMEATRIRNQKAMPKWMQHIGIEGLIGGVPVGFQDGGNVGIAALPQMGAEQPSPPMPAAPMAGIDPAMVEQTLSQMEGQVPQIDDAEDYEQMMNTIRGDEQPMEARYSELAGVVGEEDAAQTPESVLALVQPVMVMASVDQGIGGLAQEEMTQPIEGEMAGGIMSMAGQPQGV